MEQGEGVIKFRQFFNRAGPPDEGLIRTINAWRRILFLTRLIGKDSKRYDGFAYGNISKRSDGGFIITGSQTGGLENLRAEHYTRVRDYNIKKNEVFVSGPIKASSESMTHGAVYDAEPGVMSVVHGHSPEIWTKAKELGIPTIHPGVEYGTPEMAREVKRLFKDIDVAQKKIFAMGGHQDGLVSFGSSEDEAALVLIKYLVRALEL